MKRTINNLRFLMISGLFVITSLTFAQLVQSVNYLEVGVGIVDISGEDAVILDPIHVKAVVLRQGAEQIALVECDVTGVSAEMTTAARMEASLKTGIPYNNICVAATHTHMASELRRDAR